MYNFTQVDIIFVQVKIETRAINAISYVEIDNLTCPITTQHFRLNTRRHIVEY